MIPFRSKYTKDDKFLCETRNASYEAARRLDVGKVRVGEGDTPRHVRLIFGLGPDHFPGTTVQYHCVQQSTVSLTAASRSPYLQDFRTTLCYTPLRPVPCTAQSSSSSEPASQRSQRTATAAMHRGGEEHDDRRGRGRGRLHPQDIKSHSLHQNG